MAGQFDREQGAGQRCAHRPAHDRRHAQKRPEAGSSRKHHTGEIAERAAEDQQRSQNAARCPRPQGDQPDDRLHHHKCHDHANGERTVEQCLDIAIPCAEHMGIDQAAQPNHDGPCRRPPHPVQREAVKQVLNAIEKVRQDRGFHPDQHAKCDRQRGHLPAARRRGLEREHRSAADERRAPGERYQHADHHRHQASRLPFEQQHLDRQQDRSERRSEDRAHTGGCTGHEQGLSLRRA